MQESARQLERGADSFIEERKKATIHASLLLEDKNYFAVYVTVSVLSLQSFIYTKSWCIL